MGLSCDCDYEPEPGDVCWWKARDFSTLESKRSKRCCSCGDKIRPGGTVAAFDRYKVPEHQIELNIWGDCCDQGPPRATWYMCERCAGLFFSLDELGYCIDIRDDMRELVKEYAATKEWERTHAA